MAERGMLPEIFGMRSRHVGIFFSFCGVLLLSWMSFEQIVAVENVLYCLGMLLEFVAFVKSRVKYPTAARPYRIPVGTVGCALMLVPPTALIFMVLALASLRVVAVSLVVVVIGIALHPCLKFVEKKQWMRFSVTVSSELPDLRTAEEEYRGEPLLD